MTLNIDENGTVYIHQGDSGEIHVIGIPTDKNYRVYLAIRDLSRKPIGNEFMVFSEYQNSVKFTIPSSFTDLLTVSDDEHIAVYHYGLKICDNNGLEDTLFVSKSDYGKPNNIIVFPKVVEGYNE
jgi:hypothetical protein